MIFAVLFGMGINYLENVRHKFCSNKLFPKNTGQNQIE